MADPVRTRQPVRERDAWVHFARWSALIRLHQAAEQAGVAPGPDRLRFIRRRLDPDIPEAWLEGAVAHAMRLAEEEGDQVWQPPTLADVVGPELARELVDLGYVMPEHRARQLTLTAAAPGGDQTSAR